MLRFFIRYSALLPAVSLMFASSAPAEILASFNFAGGSAASGDASVYSSVDAYDARSTALGGDNSAVSAVTGTAYMRAENTPSTTDPSSNGFYHTFSITVQNLADGETLDLTGLALDYSATEIYQTFQMGAYSDATGYTGTGDKLADIDITTNGGDSFNVNLTAVNPVAGTAFTGLTNGRTVEFRFVFADNSVSNIRIHRLDNIVLHGTVNNGTPPPANLLVNPGFEDSPFDTGWNSGDVIAETGLNGSATSARLDHNTLATLGQALGPLADFTFDTYLEVAGDFENRSFRILADGNGGTAVEIRGRLGNVLQINNAGTFGDLTEIGGGANFPIPANQQVRIRIIGRDFGTATANYDVAWSAPGSTVLTHAATGLTSFANPAAATTGTGLAGIRFDRGSIIAHSYWVDDLLVIDGAEAPPTADYEFIPPLPDKVVNISGVYPHLAMTTNEGECGPGAVVPWAERLWVATYSEHSPTGSSSKLYEIDSSLHRVTRPESVGGTPANRFIHTPSNQLIIGPHFIDASRNVRTLSYAIAPGRHTAVAAHLTDPDNRVYFYTMEQGVYDVNVHDLSVITRYPDIQYQGDRFLFGYHGKGAYSGQGLLVVANNGRPTNQYDPTGIGGVLATWDGTTVADNGGAYLAGNDPNNTPEEVTKNPVVAQPDYIAGWNQAYKIQHCEVTGPGGIRGNPNPATDPIWTTGFDAKSVILRTLESGAWHTWRLPKASYTHDGAHGWHTEWPRIRQLDPATPGSPYLMHMHGLFFDFPATFSSADFSGLAPLCGYYKMPVDYCTFGGRLVISKNDTSKFANAFVPRNQSNLWFGQLSDLQNWGAPTGHGAVWIDETVASGETSDPFLVNGFTQGTLHLRNNSGTSVPVEIETSAGSGGWSHLKNLDVPANGYVHENLSGVSAQWVRLKARAAASGLTAFFHLSNPYPHAPIASQATDRFAALADIRDTTGYSDGMMRVMSGTDLKFEFATDSGYHRIGGPMVLEDINDPAAEASLRAGIPLNKDFGGDAASVWIERDGTRFRLPMLDPLYNGTFLSGWARGFREVVTERLLLNCHGTFYEVPRDSSGGIRKMRALATHGKRITDFASWRGLFVLNGVLDDAPESDSLVKSPAGAALWLGEIDDLWQMGEPRGTGGPWLDTAVTTATPSDPYLMYGYDRKELQLSHSASSDVTFTVEVDFLADNTWSAYGSFTVSPGETFTHTFPAGFHAHWVRVTSDTATTATAQFTYGPAGQRDVLLDWGRDEGLPTGSGRAAVAMANGDGDDLADLAEFVFGTDPAVGNPWPLATDQVALSATLRDLAPEDGISVVFESSTDLESWSPRPDLVTPDPDQSGVPSGFTRMLFLFPPADTRHFVRIAIL